MFQTLGVQRYSFHTSIPGDATLFISGIEAIQFLMLKHAICK
jgi:hypothetical protein